MLCLTNVVYLQVFQQELDSRQSMVAAMRSSPTADSTVATQLDELTTVWDHVNQLSQVREARLQEALKLVSRVKYLYGIPEYLLDP